MIFHVQLYNLVLPCEYSVLRETAGDARLSPCGTRQSAAFPMTGVQGHCLFVLSA